MRTNTLHDSPRVSVVMPVFNGERFLSEAIDSVLSQSFNDFEFIIVDDGSTDATPTILANYAQTDDRIVVRRQGENRGIVAALNLGCKVARGEFIARADADDVNLPERFARQVAAFDETEKLVLLGTAAQVIDHNGRLGNIIRVPASSGLMRWSMILASCIVHSSVMMRREVSARYNFYRPEFEFSEDYDFWARMSKSETIGNLPEALVKYRVWDHSISSTKQERQDELTANISYELLLHYLGKEIPKEAASVLRYLKYADSGQAPTNPEQARNAAVLLADLYHAFTKSAVLTPSEQREISTDMAMRFYRLAGATARESVFEAGRFALTGFRYSPVSVIRVFRLILSRFA